MRCSKVILTYLHFIVSHKIKKCLHLNYLKAWCNAFQCRL